MRRGGKGEERRECHCLSSLSLAAALVGGDVTTTATGSKTSTTLTLETSTALATSTVSTATASRTTTSTAIAAVGTTARTTLLKDDLFTIDLVRVGTNGSRVARGLSKLNESTVLRDSVNECSEKTEREGGLDKNAYLLAADVKVANLAEAGQSLLESVGVNLFGDVLNIAQSGLLLAGTGLGLLVVRASGLPARAVSGGEIGRAHV